MEIIKFNEIFNRKKNLLSLSIVKIIGPYKDFFKYTNGLNRILEHTNNNTYNFDVRVYFDDTVLLEIKNLINKYKNVEFYKFNYPPLRVGEFHNGTFGSLIRLLPLFEHHPDNSHMYNYIWIDDIDVLPKYINLNIINSSHITGFNTYFSSLFCYYRPWFKHSHNYNMNFPLITNVKLDPKIFYRYINDLANDKYKNIIEEILNFRPDKYKYNYKIKHPYGMDEYFTNNIIYNQLTKYNTYVAYNTDVTPLLKNISYTNGIDENYKEILKSLLDLQYMTYKATDIKVLRDINNTYIKLFNKLNTQKLFALISEDKIKYIKEYIEFINKYEMKDINDFKYIIKIS